MKDYIRLSFDVPVEEHTEIKTECVKNRKAMKDFLRQLVLIGLAEMKEQNKIDALREGLHNEIEQRYSISDIK